MRKLIDTTLQIQKSLKEKRKILLVLLDMRELGDLTEKEHRLLA
jgi:UDP-N-acetylmuramyl pentapeptide synthase